jgi:hypothetical protein
MKIRPVGAQLLNADRQDEANTRFFATLRERLKTKSHVGNNTRLQYRHTFFFRTQETARNIILTNVTPVI